MPVPLLVPLSDPVRKNASLPKSFKPGSYDVICGRLGKRSFTSPGNKRYRILISLYVETYRKASTKLDKSLIVVQIIHLIRERGGGFVKHDQTTSTWVDIGDQLAREKVSHCLRHYVRGKRACPASRSLSITPVEVLAMTDDDISQLDAKLDKLPSSSKSSPHKASDGSGVLCLPPQGVQDPTTVDPKAPTPKNDGNLVVAACDPMKKAHADTNQEIFHHAFHPVPVEDDASLFSIFAREMETPDNDGDNSNKSLDKGSVSNTLSDIFKSLDGFIDESMFSTETKPEKEDLSQSVVSKEDIPDSRKDDGSQRVDLMKMIRIVG